MTRPLPRHVYDDPDVHWSFLTQATDDGFEGQHFDRKEAGMPGPAGVLSGSQVTNIREQVTETVSAFTNKNMEGGLLVLGISCNGTVAGVDHLTEQQRNSITNINTLLVHQAAEVRLHNFKDASGNGKVICLILSPYTTSGICETPGGNPRGWLRNGSQNVPLNQTTKDQLRRSKGLTDVETCPCCPFSLQDIDRDILSEFRKVFHPDSTKDFSDERLLYEAGAIIRSNDGYAFTYPGLLFFASNPQRVMPHSYIRLLRFTVPSSQYRNRGTASTEKEFRGPVTTQIRAARKFLRESALFKRYQKRKPDGGFIEEPEFPPIAVDEAIVNAVAHRDYHTKLPVECEYYTDAFIVKNPGRILQRNIDLPDQFTLDGTTLDSMPRNGKLLEWLKRMCDPDGRAFIQAISEGTKRMAAEMLALKLPAPSYRLFENETLLKLESRADEREAALRATAKVASTEFTNIHLLNIRQGTEPARSSDFRIRYNEFLKALRDSLIAKEWYIDRCSFSRIVAHRRGAELPIPAAARKVVRFYPSYILQLHEFFGRHYLSIDFTCQVLNICKVPKLLQQLPASALVNRVSVANIAGWQACRLLSIDAEWVTVKTFEGDTEKRLLGKEVIPHLPLRLIEQVLHHDGVSLDLHAAIKKHSLASEAGASRIRAERIQATVDTLADQVFPVTFGDLEVSISPQAVSLAELIAGTAQTFTVIRLGEPIVEFRDHHASSDVRDGITRFGSYEATPHTIELVPVCIGSLREEMEQLIGRLKEGKYKYRGAERTFCTRFTYASVVTVDSMGVMEGEVNRLLDEHPDWRGETNLKRLFLVYTPEIPFALDDEKSPYYTIKRKLLEAGVPCQMVDTGTLRNPDWKDLNLALNIIAKCGVTPWVLPDGIPDADFFVGLSYTSKDGKRIMGFANVFNKYGRWEFYAGNTAAYNDTQRTQHLAELVQRTLERLRQQETLPAAPSLIFHYSARLSKEDNKAILHSVRKVIPDAAVTFVWVNSHSNVRLFDSRPEADGSLRRGSFVPVSRKQLYLSTTGHNTFRKASGTPKPLEVSAWHYRPGGTYYENYDQRVLALQTLSLTKLNWASTDAFCGEPITLKYAGDIAYLTAAFLRQKEPFELHPVLEKTPWFL